MAAALEQENVRVNLLKSDPGNYPAWIRLEGWIPLEAAPSDRHERCELELIIEAKPFNCHNLTSSARLKRGKRTIAVAHLSRFSENDVREWVGYAIGRGPRPSNYRPLRDALRQFLSLFVPALGHHHNPIDGRFRPRHAETRTLLVAAACALLVGSLAFQQALTPVALALGALVMLFAVLVPASARYHRYYDWVVPQPREAPRHLGHVDSWHLVLVGLGSDAESLKQCFIAKIKEAPPDLLVIRSETYSFRAPNSCEVRERLVVSHRQGYVYIHIYQLANDLFVGWQGHLNWAQWTETSPYTIVDSGCHSIAFRDIKPSQYYPSEFDLMDLNSLSAVVHQAVEHAVKSILTKYSVDSAIDFEVIRSDRGNALDTRKAWPERSINRRRNSKSIFRWGGARQVSMGGMKLLPIGIKPGSLRSGISAIPAFILLPILAALGYGWLYLLRGTQLLQFEFRGPSESNMGFSFLPMFDFPLAVVLAFGLWLYAGIGLLRALLVIALIEAADFSTSFGYDFLAGIELLNVTVVPNLLSVFCYLLAASIWVPTLRQGRRWLVAMVLWTAGVIARLELSLPVLMAACIGFWLWRDARVPIGLSNARTTALRTPVSATVRRPTVGAPYQTVDVSESLRPSSFEIVFWLAAIGSIFALPTFHVLLVQLVILGLFTFSLDLVVGYAGIISLGHAVFFGAGAYAAGLIAKYGIISEPSLALLLAGLVAAALGFATSFLVVRGSILSRLTATLGVSGLVYELANRFGEFTGGADGLEGITTAPIFDIYPLSGSIAYLYSLVWLFALFVLARWIVRSPFGLTLKRIKGNEASATAVSFAFNWRLVAIYTLAAGYAGVAGGLLAQTQAFASPSMLSLERSVDALFALIIGGTGYLYGGLIGTVIVQLLQEYLSDISARYWQFWIGALLCTISLLGFERSGRWMARQLNFRIG
jgi:branched-chain amino acid transport system permease protein